MIYSLVGGDWNHGILLVNLWLIMVNNWNNNIVWLVVWNMNFIFPYIGNNNPN